VIRDWIPGVPSLVWLAGVNGETLRVGPAVFYFTLIVVAVPGPVLFGAGRLKDIELRPCGGVLQRDPV
jgi:hypothetical protein